jgi:hypothetical protein
MTVLLGIMAVILVVTALYSISNQNQYLRHFGRDIRNLLDEANMVKTDMEALLQNAVAVSDAMVNRMDERLNRMEVLTNPAEHVREFPRKRRSGEKQKKPAGHGSVSQLNDIRKAHPYIAVPRLYYEGYTIAEIAGLLEKGQGEIKLILDIQRKREVGS